MSQQDTAQDCLCIVNHMWGILANEIADAPAYEVLRDVRTAIPHLERYLEQLKKLTIP
ncbi:MAG: hypothetical protein FWB76_00195 [Oscillospiraceae bacterium]|nr:hypothetical protein [Oscillospiraceae bacterium]